MLSALGLLAIGGALAEPLAGVALPEEIELDGQPLRLNGAGLLEKLTFDIYVGGLYLPVPMHDSAAIVAAEVPKRLVMHFTFRLPASRIRAEIRSGFATVPASRTPEMQARIDRFVSWVERGAAPGDELVVDCLPGRGTTMWYGGERKGTIEGDDFARMLVAVFVGDDPPSEALRRGLLGLD